MCNEARRDHSMSTKNGNSDGVDVQGRSLRSLVCMPKSRLRRSIETGAKVVKVRNCSISVQEGFPEDVEK